MIKNIDTDILTRLTASTVSLKLTDHQEQRVIMLALLNHCHENEKRSAGRLETPKQQDNKKILMKM